MYPYYLKMVILWQDLLAPLEDGVDQSRSWRAWSCPSGDVVTSKWWETSSSYTPVSRTCNLNKDQWPKSVTHTPTADAVSLHLFGTHFKYLAKTPTIGRVLNLLKGRKLHGHITRILATNSLWAYVFRINISSFVLFVFHTIYPYIKVYYICLLTFTRNMQSFTFIRLKSALRIHNYK